MQGAIASKAKHSSKSKSMVYNNLYSVDNSNEQLKPWNSTRLGLIQSSLPRKNNQKSIFCLSNRNSLIKVTQKQSISETPHSFSFKRSTTFKPKTAPHQRRPKNTILNTNYNQQVKLSRQMTRLGPVATEQVLDDRFEQNLESINFYAQFKSSVQQRKNLLYLKPYLKSGSINTKNANQTTMQGIEKLKSQLYRNINNSSLIYNQEKERKNEDEKDKFGSSNRSNMIQYMTEYGEQNDNEKVPQRQRQKRSRQKITSINVLRDKLKRQYQQSAYADKIIMIKSGLGIPITIIQ